MAKGWWPVGAVLSAKRKVIGMDTREKSPADANVYFLFSSFEQPIDIKTPKFLVIYRVINF